MDSTSAGVIPPLPGPPPPAPGGWWRRHWKWAVPALAGTGLLLVIAVVALFVAALLGTMKSSDAYRVAVETAQRDPALIAAIGAPIEPGWFFSGNVATRSGGTGEADLRIPLRGSHGQADLVVEAGRVDGRWLYTTLEAVVEGGETIPLRTGQRASDTGSSNRIDAASKRNTKGG